MSNYVAVLVDITEVSNIPPTFMPYVNFKAKLETRTLEGSERVAIFNISSTSSYFSIFLDKGKTIEEIEAEMLRDSTAKMNHESRVSVKNAIY